MRSAWWTPPARWAGAASAPEALAWRALAWGALMLLAGCGPSALERMDTARPFVVDEVRLEGVERFEKDDFLSYLHVGESSRWPWGDDVRYGGAYPRLDRQLIEQLYAAYGHHQAKVTRLVIVGPKPGDTEVDVEIVVEEGPPTTVGGVEVEGRLPAEAKPPKVGDRFDLPALSAAEARARAALRAEGHGFAQVSARAEVDRTAHTAQLHFKATPGPKLTISEVRLEGLKEVPEALVASEVEFAAGRPWSPALEDEVEGAVYALDVFASVRALLPETPPAGDGPVPLRLEVRERAFDELKVGVGFGFQPARWEERLSARYVHRNLFGNLTRLDLRAKLGWAQIPTAFDPQATGPLVSVAPTFEKKGLLERELRWTLAPAYDLGIEQGYQFHRVRNRVGVSRFFFGRTRAQASYTLEFFDFFNIGDALDANRTALGRDFRDPYLLGYLTFDYRVYLTDDILQPTRGVAFGATWDVAGPVGGDFAFHRVRPEITAYARPFSWLRLAARAELGYIFTADGGAVPLAMKWYLGGADTVRGWGANRLSPQISADCPEGQRCAGVPVGGSTLVLANLEARVPIYGPIEIAAFVDMGDVQDAERRFVSEEWSYSVGGGLRIATPIGRFRLDAAGRVNNPEKFSEESRWALHLALGEPF